MHPLLAGVDTPGGAAQKTHFLALTVAKAAASSPPGSGSRQAVPLMAPEVSGLSRTGKGRGHAGRVTANHRTAV